MDTTRVLVPLDGSPMGEAALDYLSILTSLGTLQVRLVAVAEDPVHYGLPDPDAWQERQVNLLKEYLSAKQLELQKAGLDVETGVRLGYASDAVLKDIAQYRPDFVAISTHGRSGMARFRLGSVADKVIRGSGCNTLVVGPQPASWPLRKAVESIMLPLDGSEFAEQAIPMASRLALALKARLHLVRVVDMPFTAEDVLGPVGDRTIKNYLDDKAKELARIETTVSILDGFTDEALRTYVARHEIGLVVLTSHGYGGILRFALGSVAERLIGGNAPVLVVRPQEG